MSPYAARPSTPVPAGSEKVPGAIPGEIRGEILETLAGFNCARSLVLAERTRRAVREEAISLEEERIRQRQILGFVLLTVLCISILLAPAIWGSIEELLGGEYLADLPVQVAFLLLMLLPTMLAVLFAAWKGDHEARHDRRSF